MSIDAFVDTGDLFLPRLQAAIDRSEIEQQINRHFLSPDEKRIDTEWLESIYTEDFVLTLPHGSYVGPEGLRDALRTGAAMFEQSHHLIANNVITIDGDTASVKSKLIATHLTRAAEPQNAYTAGADYSFRLRRTAEGWRLTEAIFAVVWTRGEPPSFILPQPTA